MTTSGDNPKGMSATVKGAFITAAAALLAASITGGVLLYNASNSPSQSSSAGSSSMPTSSPISRSTSQSNAGTTRLPQSNSAPPTNGDIEAIQYLSDEKAVSNHFGTKSGSSEITQQAYPHSLWVGISACSTSNHEVEYNIESGWTKFAAWVGLNKESATGLKILFQVYLDDVPYGSGYAKSTLEPAEEIVLPISGKSRIKLTAVWVSGGRCNAIGSFAYATWGNAQFSK